MTPLKIFAREQIYFYMNKTIYTFRNKYRTSFRLASFVNMTRHGKELVAKLKSLRRTKDRKTFIKQCDTGVIKGLCECIRNLLKGNVSLKASQLNCLARHRRWLRSLSLKMTSLAKHKQILQTGGFIRALISPLLGGLIQLLKQ